MPIFIYNDEGKDIPDNQGTLLYDNENNRFEVLYSNSGRRDSISCGTCFQLAVNDTWESTRIELGTCGWYLTPHRLCGVGQLRGLRIRM